MERHTELIPNDAQSFFMYISYDNCIRHCIVIHDDHDEFSTNI